MCIFMCVYLSTYTYISPTFVYMHTYLCVCRLQDVCMPWRLLTRVCMRVCVYACMHACVRVCMRACVCACVRVSWRMCVRADRQIYVFSTWGHAVNPTVRFGSCRQFLHERNHICQPFPLGSCPGRYRVQRVCVTWCVMPRRSMRLRAYRGAPIGPRYHLLDSLELALMTRWTVSSSVRLERHSCIEIMQLKLKPPTLPDFTPKLPSSQEDNSHDVFFWLFWQFVHLRFPPLSFGFPRLPSPSLAFRRSMFLDHPGSSILAAGCWIVVPGSGILDPGSWLQDPGCSQYPGCWILDQGSWVLDPGSWVRDPSASKAAGKPINQAKPADQPASMTLPWHCDGIGITLPRHCRGNAMAMAGQCHSTAMAMALLCRCHCTGVASVAQPRWPATAGPASKSLNQQAYASPSYHKYNQCHL